jgi:hypothetical protein
MERRRTSLQQKLAWMREQHADPAPTAPPAFAERHYNVAQIAAMWGLSQDTVRRLFQFEPGVLIFGGQQSAHTRRYTTLRIPESVVRRVHNRLARPVI